MPRSLEIHAFGVEEAEAAFERFAEAGGDLSQPFEQIGQYMLEQTHRHFSQERSAEGDPWQALTEEYVHRPESSGGRGGLEHPILYWSGRLEESIQYEASATDVAIGTDLKPYAAIHQFGGTAGRGAFIPARPYLGINQEDENKIADFMIDYLASLVE